MNIRDLEMASLYINTHVYLYKVTPLVVLNMSHIDLGGHSLLRTPNHIIGGGTCPPAPPGFVAYECHAEQKIETRTHDEVSADHFQS